MVIPSKTVGANTPKKIKKNHITLIQNRDGIVVKYDISRIEEAIFKALSTTGEGGKKEAKELAKKVAFILNHRFKKGEIPNVENIQDLVEETLILQEYAETAKNYILYREQRRRVRENKITKEEAVDLVGSYLDTLDWEVKENSNMEYSLQGLNNYIANNITKKYWLNKIYPKEIRDAAKDNLFHIHDLGTLGAYCCGWDLYDLLVKGFGGVRDKIQSAPPKHFHTALGQMVNFFYTLQGEVAGAQAFSNFDLLLSPFIRYDNLNSKEIKQALQEFLFNVNVPTRVGFQCLSEDTEILTIDGWKNYEGVKKGDIIKTFNLETQEVEDKKVSLVFKKEYSGIMYNIKNKDNDQLISPKHRVVRKIAHFDFGEYILDPIENVLKLEFPIIVIPKLAKDKMGIYAIKNIKGQEILVKDIKKIDYSGVIWSVHTENETVIARRNGKVFVTGNTPFTNITLDLKVPEYYKNMPVIIGGKMQKETYSEFQTEMDLLNKTLCEVFEEGDATGRVFTFPIPTYNITKDFDWENSNYDGLWKMTAKYGIPSFSNFINSELSPSDATSMCCRLRLSNQELYKRGGGLFGAAPKTGSLGVVTINLPHIAYLSKTRKEFFDRLREAMDLAKQSLEIKRKTVENFTLYGLYPYCKYYLQDVKKMRGAYWANHFSTVGLVGGHEMCLNFLGCSIADNEGKKFMEEVLDFMRNRLIKYQEETDNLYNLEATPAEGTSYRLACIDKKMFPDIITSGTKEAPYYTNSSQLPVGYSDDLFEVLDHQDSLQRKYTGGCVEKGNKVLTDKGLIKIEDIVRDFKKLKPLRVVSYNKGKDIGEWDEVVDAVSIDVKKHDKIRVMGERNLDITTSDWHLFFVLKRNDWNKVCPVCKQEVKNIKSFAVHIKNNPNCLNNYENINRYEVVEKRADELKVGDYILQNNSNLYPEREMKLNNDLMWLLGFFIGDGSISKYFDDRGGNHIEKNHVCFFSEHQEALSKVASILNKYFQCNVSVIKNDNRSDILREVITSKASVIDFFFQYGFKTGEKVYDVCISPLIKKNITSTNIFSLLSGLLDSDGHLNKKTGELEYYTVSTNLVEDLIEIFSRAGIMFGKFLKKTKRDNEVDIWRLRIPCYEVVKMQTKLTNTFNSERIDELLSNRKKRFLPVVRVKSISKIDVKDNQFYDLMTKRNHNYLAGKDCMVFIHNTILHGFIGEEIRDAMSIKSLIKNVFSNYELPYMTITPTFSICPTHGYIAGEHFLCPKCVIEQRCEVYSRVVGYLRPVQNWHVGKQEEFKERLTFKWDKASDRASLTNAFNKTKAKIKP